MRQFLGRQTIGRLVGVDSAGAWRGSPVASVGAEPAVAAVRRRRSTLVRFGARPRHRRGARPDRDRGEDDEEEVR